MTEDRGGMTDDRGAVTEDRGGMTEDRGAVTEDRGAVTEDRGAATEDRGAVTEDRANFFFGPTSDLDFGSISFCACALSASTFEFDLQCSHLLNKDCHTMSERKAER